MALQGNLHDFSAMEILQLLGSQKKSGCLVLEWNTERSMRDSPPRRKRSCRRLSRRLQT